VTKNQIVSSIFCNFAFNFFRTIVKPKDLELVGALRNKILKSKDQLHRQFHSEIVF